MNRLHLLGLLIQPNFNGFTREVNVKVVNANSTFDFDINGPAATDTFQQSRKITIPGAIGFLWVGNQNFAPGHSSNVFRTGIVGNLLAFQNESEEIEGIYSFQYQGNVNMASKIHFNGPLPYIANVRKKDEGEADYTFIADASTTSWINTYPNIQQPLQGEVQRKLSIDFTGTGGDPGSILKFDVIHGANQNLVKSYTIFRA